MKGARLPEAGPRCTFRFESARGYTPQTHVAA